MRVFLTGASGWIGSATLRELVVSGHEVVGLARSESSAARIEELGGQALRGDLDDLESLRRGAQEADGVVHLANKHDWADPSVNDRAERAAVETMLEVLGGGERPFVVANGLTGLPATGPGGLVLETDASPEVGPTADRGGSENLVLESDARGIAVRFAPSVHGAGDWGFVNFLTAAARERGVSGYIGDGETAWSAVHRDDAARLIRLGVEGAPAGTRMHAVAEEAISTRLIAEAIGSSLDLPVVSVPPEEADAHFGFVAEFFGQTLTASSEHTRELLGWQPSGPTLVEDIADGAYSDE